MKITIELSEAEVKGLKAYLKDVDDVKADKDYIKQHIQGIVSGTINAPQEAVSDYIKKFINDNRNNNNNKKSSSM